MIEPLLPQNDLNSVRRENCLSKSRSAYHFDRNCSSSLELPKELPALENFSVDYLAERIRATAELPINMLAVKARSFLDPLDDLQDYEDFFPVLPLPAIAKTYQTDRAFAEQRASGANPMVLRLLDPADKSAQILAKLPSFKLLCTSRLLPKELQGKNIYIADYTGTDPNYISPAKVQGGTYEKGRKYLPKPRAFFGWFDRTNGTGVRDSAGRTLRDRGEMVPLAIQLDINPESHVYTPSDPPLDWLFAKLCVQVADANHHEMRSHLARTHLVMEPFAIATARQLAPNHPISLLLAPHFRFMLANNNLARARLIEPGGIVDRLLAGTLKESLSVAREAVDTWRVDRAAFPIELSDRGLLEKSTLPHYPYRDDGLLVWNAIGDFVSSFVDCFYKCPNDFLDDWELQTWNEELSQKMSVKALPKSISNKVQLTGILQTIIFTCSAQHSAINYTQHEYMSFVPNMPLALYSNIKPANKTELLRCLPPNLPAAEQLEILYALSAYQYDRLGYYDKSYCELYGKKVTEIFDKAAIAAFDRFQKGLETVEREIDRRNSQRWMPYNAMKPSLIANSISI